MIEKNSCWQAIEWRVTDVNKGVRKNVNKGKFVHVHVMEARVRSRGTTPLIFTSSLDGGKWSNSRPGRFSPGKKTGTH
jgi:hypothetical protein